MPTPLTARDPVAEQDFLTSIRQLNFLLLQRDWRSVKHGDLDILLSRVHWSQFIDRVTDFCAEKSYPLAKAYEIEEGVVCIIVLTPQGRIHLDVALSGPRARLFGVDMENALGRRDLSEQFPIAHAEDAVIYAKNKAKYKKSYARRLLNKASNLRVILRRIINSVVIVDGAALYIPFVSDSDILRCNAIITHNRAYLEGALRKRYLFQRNDI